MANRLSDTPVNQAFIQYRVSSSAAARFLGVRYQTVNYWRAGRNRVSPTYAKKLNAKYGMPLHLLRPDIWEAPKRRTAA